ncbi:MAG: SDR family oxidoreductase [Chloroflexi bacterium]|nr:SDR family oxidoreductase [Chloroflexota bacterium]MCI0574936.1 SDR family oxidoreductase [Chloroflexota bacterium]MCI0645846.1 SDR family oxidoreductase [Chloroflexota bacterium]MCI0725701.1 SDR family oxidoreductase [Chloroflexota bacterium]
MEQITPRINFSTELANLFDLTGKVAYLPGGYGGIGESLAWGLALHGARVVISGRSLARAEALAGRLQEAGYEATAVAVDVKSVAEIRESAGFVVDQYGRLDILVNCVGVQREEPLLEVTEEAFDEVYAVNLKAAMFLAQAAARHQVAWGQGGKQIHLLSVRSQLGLRDRGYSAYSSTKGGLLMLVKQHAMELARYHITVNGIAPTFTYTEMIRHVMENDEFRAQLLSRIPLGRIADPKDIVGATLFFAAPAANYITGQVLYIDGGITASQ